MFSKMSKKSSESGFGAFFLESEFKFRESLRIQAHQRFGCE